MMAIFASNKIAGSNPARVVNLFLRKRWQFAISMSNYLPANILLFFISLQNKSTARGFEPLRAEPNGFLVHHLNHSVTLS